VNWFKKTFGLLASFTVDLPLGKLHTCFPTIQDIATSSDKGSGKLNSKQTACLDMIAGMIQQF